MGHTFATCSQYDNNEEEYHFFERRSTEDKLFHIWLNIVI